MAGVFPQAIPVIPATATPGTPVTVNCIVRETLPVGHPPDWCTAARGRAPGPVTSGQDTCVVQQLSVPLGSSTAPAGHGFYYDTSTDPSSPDCRQRITFTSGDSVITGGSATIQCFNGSTH